MMMAHVNYNFKRCNSSKRVVAVIHTMMVAGWWILSFSVTSPSVILQAESFQQISVGVGPSFLHSSSHRPRRTIAPPRNALLLSSTADGSLADDTVAGEGSVGPNTRGLYKKFEEHAWERLSSTGWFEDLEIPSELSKNEATAKGGPTSPTNSNPPIVRITTRAMVPKSSSSSSSDNFDHRDLVRYARIALLETVPQTMPPDSEDSSVVVHSAGIQVLNFVILPSEKTTLPVLGIDLVSLPGGRHLLLLDAQPMIQPNNPVYEDEWKGWYEKYVANDRMSTKFPFGGDFPKEVQQYVSKYSLWTRLQDIEEDPINVIENDVYDAFVDHLDIYLGLLRKTAEPLQQAESQQDSESVQASYLEYRKNNDPAKPMLTSLYGQEWTEQLLQSVLFPQDK